MNDQKSAEIEKLEKMLRYLIRPDMTLEEKIKALKNSFWRSHNSGYCDYMAGREMGGEVSADTELWDNDCKYKWEVEKLIDLLEQQGGE